MRRLRRALGPIATAWLVCQTASLLAVPVVLGTNAAAHPLACTCAHGDHGMCPMHHKLAPSNTCAMRSADHADTAVLSFMWTPAGVLTQSAHDMILSSPRAIIRGVVVSPSGRPARPDLPPPRA